LAGCHRRPSAACRAARIEHDDTLVAVAVGDEQLVGLAIDHHLGGPAEMLGVVRSARRAGLADPHHELAVARELEDVPASLDIVADPDEVVVVDMDAVPVVAPGIARAIAAPALHHLAVLIELDHRRRRHATFSFGAVEARFSRASSALGRWLIQMWSCASTVMPPMVPMIQLLGSAFGQLGSTSNFGTVCADAGASV
jgi:hypothetical protein